MESVEMYDMRLADASNFIQEIIAEHIAYEEE